MGGSKPSHHLLLTLPFPQPPLLDSIAKRHPDLKITYIHIKPVDNNPFTSKHDIPEETWADVTILTTLTVLPDPKLVPKLEYVVMTLLAASHSYNQLLDWQRSHKWRQSLDLLSRVRDQVGQRIGVLGYGSIGRQVGRIAKAMGMDVLAFTATPRPTPESKRDRGFVLPGTGDPNGEFPSAWYSGLDKDSLHDFLRQDLDVLVICVPLTKETRKFLGKEEFDILGRRNAFLVNIARGRVLDQEALISALDEFVERDGGKIGESGGGLRGAALDVANPEPLPDGHPLFSSPNTFLSPHVSGHSVAYDDRALQVLEINVDRWEKGERLLNLVNKERGY